jgi:hypothetical protein
MKIDIGIEPAKREEIARGLSCDLLTRRMQLHEKAAWMWMLCSLLE